MRCALCIFMEAVAKPVYACLHMSILREEVLKSNFGPTIWTDAARVVRPVREEKESEEKRIEKSHLPSGQMRDQKLHPALKSKYSKHLGLGALLEFQLFKKCTPLWREALFEVNMYKTHVELFKKCTRLRREAHFEVKMVKTPQCWNTFGRWAVQNCARRCGAKHTSKIFEVNMIKTPRSDHFWAFNGHFSWQAQDSASCQKWAKPAGFAVVAKTTAGVGRLKRIQTTLHYNYNCNYDCNYTTIAPTATTTTTLRYTRLQLHYTYDCSHTTTATATAIATANKYNYNVLQLHLYNCNCNYNCDTTLQLHNYNYNYNYTTLQIHYNYTRLH